MRVLGNFQTFNASVCRFLIFAVGVGLSALLLVPPKAIAEDAAAAIEKTNLYIEVVKNTERAVDSWERYASWVNMKSGPTGKERYITYGMYDLYDVDDLLKQTKAAAASEPRSEALDSGMLRYIAGYEALAPVMNEAAGYYDRQGYATDKVAKGQQYHKQMVPLATVFLAERDHVSPLLRARIREVEALELAGLKSSDGSSAAFHTANVMLTLNRVIDTFPHQRPQPIASDEMEQMMAELGPDTPGEKFDQIIAGVKPIKDATIDVEQFNAAMKSYQEAVIGFDGFSGDKPDDFDEFKPLPSAMLEQLHALQEPLAKNGGREFQGAGQMVGRIVEQYYDMLNESQSIWNSQLRQLP